MAQKAYALHNWATMGGNPIDSATAGEIVTHFRVFARDTVTNRRDVVDVDSVILNGDSDAQAHAKNTTAVFDALQAMGYTTITRTTIRFTGWINGV